MSDIFGVTCPGCGGKTFKTVGQPKSYDDLVGASCVLCGTILTDEEIKRQAIEIARQRIKKAIKDGGM